MEQLSPEFKTKVLWWNGDDADIRSILVNPTSSLLKSLIGKAGTLVIDEAQRIENIGLCIKLIVDQIKRVKFFAYQQINYNQYFGVRMLKRRSTILKKEMG